tara:strand:- start:132 stop:374 length:243 start_codon:yes stop_codon:yes gene_type:complete
MQVIVPWVVDPNSTTLSQLDLAVYPYIVSTKRDETMSIEEIIMRLEAAYEDKDWDAVDLLLEDLRVAEEDVDQWSESWDD